MTACLTMDSTVLPVNEQRPRTWVRNLDFEAEIKAKAGEKEVLE
jgi:hypothetical protein